MRELRVQHRGEPYRIFYAFDPRRATILLIGGNKTGDAQFYERMVPLADQITTSTFENSNEHRNRRIRQGGDRHGQEV